MIGVVIKQPQNRLCGTQRRKGCCMRSAVVCGMTGAAVQKGESRIFAEKGVVENLGGLTCCKVWTRCMAWIRCKTECISLCY